VNHVKAAINFVSLSQNFKHNKKRYNRRDYNKSCDEIVMPIIVVPITCLYVNTSALLPECFRLF